MVDLLYLVALVAAGLAGYLLWKLVVRLPRLDSPRPARTKAAARPAAPDDDPEFLRALDERLRQEGGDPPR